MYDQWQSIIEWVLEKEGGYSNHPDDPGGKTRYGISQRSFPNLDLDALTIEDAVQIYWDYYWKPLWMDKDWWPGDKHEEVLKRLVFDYGVNGGVWRSIHTMQEAYNNLALGPHLVEDGRIGPLTFGAVSGIAEAYRPAFLMTLASLRGLNYLNADKAQFVRGWMNRLWDCAFGERPGSRDHYRRALQDVQMWIESKLREVEP